MNIKIQTDWKNILKNEFQKVYFNKLVTFIKFEYQTYICYPKGRLIFNSFNLTPFNEVRVVILGQDPYFKKNQANGLSFAVNNNTIFPPSLRNIFVELKNDLGIKKCCGNLEDWAKQGVLLLNSILTVRENQPGSHQKKGWEKFTNQVIKLISNEKESIVFILWGNYAKEKEQIIDTSKHYIIKSSHPSPLSCYQGFFNSKPFSKTNKFLITKKLKPINW